MKEVIGSCLAALAVVLLSGCSSDTAVTESPDISWRTETSGHTSQALPARESFLTLSKNVSMTEAS